jgi:arabinan endo-1,5-alpha-L-arabinosidase
MIKSTYQQVQEYIFPVDSTTRPAWAVSDFWAPEIHHLWGYYIAIFAARNVKGMLCVGLAYSEGSILGPYIDMGES